MKTGSIVVNTCDEGVIDPAILLRRIASGEIFFAGDHVDLVPPVDCPIGQFVKTNSSAAYNTRQANARASDCATQSLINILHGKDDPYVVNPTYTTHENAPRTIPLSSRA